jgi:hypothetical protein
MTNSTQPPHNPSSLAWVLIFVLLLGAGVGLRLYRIDADAPGFFADNSQDLTTDGGYLTLAAKDKVAFGQWTLFGYERWQTFKVSLVTGLAYLLFTSFGISTSIGVMTGVLLSTLGLLLILACLARSLPVSAVGAMTVVFAFNFVLILYGRFPFSENALLFLLSLFVAAFVYRSDSLGSAIVLGILIAVAAVFGKAFGLILVAGPIAWWLSEGTPRKWLLSLTLFAATASSTVALSLAALGKFELLSFLWGHAAEGHGTPRGLGSPLGFVEHLVTFARTGLHSYTPFLSLLTFIALGWMIFYRESEARLRKISTFAASWLIAWIVALAPFNYRPLRYQYLLIIPMTIIAAMWMARAPYMERRNQKAKWWQALVLLLLNWYFVYNVIIPFVLTSKWLDDAMLAVWYVLPAAIILTVLELLYLLKSKLKVSTQFALGIGITMIALGVLNDLRLYYQWQVRPTYSIRNANADFSEIVGPDAVIGGQFGPAVTAGNRLRSFPIFISNPLAEYEPLLRQYPITHLAVSASLWSDLTKADQRLTAIPVIARFWLRDNAIYVLPVYDLFGNFQAQEYKPTSFEEAVRLAWRGESEGIQSRLRTCLDQHPDNTCVMLTLYFWYAHQHDLRSCAWVVEGLLERCPNDYPVVLLAAVYFRWRSLETGNQELMRRAQSYLEQAVRLNPLNEDFIRQNFVTVSPDAWTL